MIGGSRKRVAAFKEVVVRVSCRNTYMGGSARGERLCDFWQNEAWDGPACRFIPSLPFAPLPISPSPPCSNNARFMNENCRGTCERVNGLTCSELRRVRVIL